MPIYRCKQCSFVAEDTSTPVGEKIGCARCGTPCVVYGTVVFVEKLVKRYVAAMREIKTLQTLDSSDIPSAPAPYTLPATLLPLLASVDSQHTAPLTAWFAARQIDIRFEHAQVDTHGYFDDAARQIGAQYNRFAELIERIGYAYRNSHTVVHLDLGSQAPQDAQAVNTLCGWLYVRSFFARYHYQKPEKTIQLTLRPSVTIREFFDGGWLQRAVFLRLQDLFTHRAPGYACARSAKLVPSHDVQHTMDVLFLPPGQPPVCVACTTGASRNDIDTCLRLRHRLGLDRSRFILCAADLSDAQAAGLSALHALSFVNLASLGPHVAHML
nr:hypothetical protein [uncultured Albidiferax sp.]